MSRVHSKTLSVVFLVLIVGSSLGAQQEKAVLLSDVLANPSQFHNKTIEVRGFLLQAFENSALYTSDKWQGSKGIWITPVVDLHVSRAEVNRHYVVVTGVFNANNHGHLDQFRGTLLIRKLVVENTNSENSSKK